MCLFVNSGVRHVLCPMLLVSPDCPILIASSVFSNVFNIAVFTLGFHWGSCCSIFAFLCSVLYIILRFMASDCPFNWYLHTFFERQNLQRKCTCQLSSHLGTDHLTCRGGGYGFLFRSEIFFRTTRELEYFFPEYNIRLYDKNSESEYFFFLHQNQNIFFSNIGNQNIFLDISRLDISHISPHSDSKPTSICTYSLMLLCMLGEEVTNTNFSLWSSWS